MKHEGWASLPELGVSLQASQIDLLEQYEALLVEKAAPMGMIAASDLTRLRDRHILDCLRADPLLPEGPASLCDLGSGAGLPGIPLAIARPDTAVILTEVRRNRAAFLEETCRTLGLSHVRVHPRRLETLRERVDVCLARAFAPAPKAWATAQRLLAPSGRLIYWAGERFDPATDSPSDATLVLFPTSALARSGPLAIMTPQ